MQLEYSVHTQIVNKTMEIQKISRIVDYPHHILYKNKTTKIIFYFYLKLFYLKLYSINYILFILEFYNNT